MQELSEGNMKKVIEIDDDLKTALDEYFEGKRLFIGLDNGLKMLEAIRNGTPLPKGHSRLIAEPTEEDIAKTIGGQSDFADCIRDSVKAVYNNAPTIIEADKE